MQKVIWLGALLLSAATAAAQVELTPIEDKWLRAAESVLDYAQVQGLSVDVSIRMTSEPNDVPLSMGVKDGRCKLVLAMRDNPQAEATLLDVSPLQHFVFIEAMVAHELAHCWRYTQGAWHTVPAGFTDLPTADSELERKRIEMRTTRREEGYADLAALAWIARSHPLDYAAVCNWMLELRSDQPVAGGHHDTRAWVRLAQSAAVFPDGGTPFEQALGVWALGLHQTE